MKTLGIVVNVVALSIVAVSMSCGNAYALEATGAAASNNAGPRSSFPGSIRVTAGGLKFSEKRNMVHVHGIGLDTETGMQFKYSIKGGVGRGRIWGLSNRWNGN